MTDRLVIRKGPDGTWPKAGTWRPIREENGRRTAYMGCPECGEISHLGDHAIDPHGNVSPSVVCPSCNRFHRFIQLEGWRE